MKPAHTPGRPRACCKRSQSLPLEAFTQIFDIVDDDRRGDVLVLGSHVFSDAVGGDDFSCVVGQKPHEVFEEGNI